MLTPSEVSTKLKIQPSTLRKYSALLEQEGIHFKRTHKNARLYTDSEYIATATLNEVKQLKMQLKQQEERQKERDLMFVEVLEKMQRKIDVLEDQQKQLLAHVPEKPELNAPESPSQQPESEPETVTPKKDTRGLWARIWNK